MPSGNCPSPDTLADWASGNLSDEQADFVVEHLDNCESCDQSLSSIETVCMLEGITTAVATEGFVQEDRCREFVDAIQHRPTTAEESRFPSPIAGKQIRDYELLDPIGHGAMGSVFKARHTRLNKLVAIKVLTDKLSGDVSAVARFQREMQAVGQLQHSNIVQALDAGEADGVPFLVMELVEGLDVSWLTVRRRSLEVADACEIVRQAATGLQHAHAEGLVHRDIKPSNLMLTLDDDGQCRVKILDLGLATFDGPDAERHLTDEGQLMGTLEFMAPEQAEDTHTVDSRADIYSLGATLYRLLTGIVPLDGPEYNTPVKRLKALMTVPVPAISTRRNDLPDDLAALVDRMLSSDPNERPQDMAEVVTLLNEFAAKHQLKRLLKKTLIEQRPKTVDSNSTDLLRDTEPSLGETIDFSARENVAESDTGSMLRPAASRPGFRLRLMGAVSAVLFLLGVIWVKTDGGYIRVKTTDPSIDVSIQVVKDGEAYPDLRVGGDGSNIWFRSGIYEFKLPTDVNDTLAIGNSSFTLTRDGEQVVTISRTTGGSLPENNSGSVLPAVSHEPRIITVTNTLADLDEPGSLRAAIAEADNGDIIQFDPALSGSTIELRGRTIKLHGKKLKIDGSGLEERLTLDAQGRCRVVEISDRAEVTLDSLIITGGYSRGGGAGIDCGPDVTVEIIRCAITDNKIPVEIFGGAGGGGIHNHGVLSLRDCVISNNRATSGAGVSNTSSGVVVLENCRILKNTSRWYGGGLCCFGNTTLRDCEIAENESTTRGGGGIYFQPDDPEECTLTLERCLIRNNRCERDGAGLRTRGNANLVNCVITRNACENTGSVVSLDPAAMSLIHCTIVENSGGGLRLFTNGETVIESTIIARNTGDIMDFMASDASLERLTLRGISIIGSTNVLTALPPETLLGVEPLLHPLGDYGGPLFSTPPQGGSPAIDAAITLGETPASDIRGMKRPVDGNDDGQSLPDIGAVEFVRETDGRLYLGMTADGHQCVMNPLELRGTEGATPAITLAVTNTIGSTARLHGWIDFNQDGKLDSATEEAQATISSGKTAGRVTLTFPTIPRGSVGQTSARFQLSMDSTAAATAGTASEGEVEDYVFTITAPGSGTVDDFLKIASDTSGGPTLADGDRFGSSVANIGDLNGDGVDDLAVGASLDDTGGDNRGAVHVLFMNADGTVASSTKIGDGTGGGPNLGGGDYFGSAVAAVGDLDGDGVTELAVGASGDNIDGSDRGAVYILFLNTDGTAKSFTLIANNRGGGPGLTNFDRFGTSVASIGDFDGDGVADLAVGARGNDTGGSGRGAVYVLLLNADGTVKSHQKIADGVGGLVADTLEDSDFFGFSVTSVGDLNGDGVPDLAVGASEDENDSAGDASEGAVYVLLMNADGTVLSQQKITDGNPGGLIDGTLGASDDFGSSVTGVGDLDGDGVPDLVVGAQDDENGDTNEGAIYVLLLNPDGTVKQQQKISDGNPGGLTNGILSSSDDFGTSVSAIGDLNNDGIIDLAVGAKDNNTGGPDRGALYVVFLSPL